MIKNPDKKSALDSLEGKLNSSQENISHVRDFSLRKKAHDVKKEWEEKIQSGEVEDYVIEKKPFFQKLLTIAAVFFGIALLVSVALFIFGTNTISTDNVIITASGPSQVEAGERASIDIRISNGNNVPLKNAKFAVRFPDNTRNPDNLNEELRRIEEDIDQISSGGSFSRTISAVFFGERGSSQDVVISIEYEVEGSTAVFQVERLYTLTLGSSPINIRIEGTREVSSGSEALMEVTITSNSNTPINNLVVEAQYPFGFEFKSSSPDPGADNNKWMIRELLPGSSETIEISGLIAGQDGEERIFRVTAGIENPRLQGELGTPIFSVSHGVVISKPALALAVSVNNSESEEVVIRDGNVIRVNIAWQNNSSVNIVGAELRAVISGNVLNKQSVSVSQGGSYSSANDTITWRAANTPALAEIRPGQSGNVSFTILTTPFASFSFYPDSPQIKVESSIEGRSPDRTGRESLVSGRREVLMKVSTVLDVRARLLREIGPISNSGPIPPRVEEETTYTVSWSISNTANNADRVRVIARLPDHVEWTGSFSPSSENIIYIASERQVVWEVGRVSRLTGFQDPAREAYFQIVFTPSANQVNSVPQVLGGTQVTGQDTFAGIPVSSTFAPLTTVFSSDPSYRVGDNTVRP